MSNPPPSQICPGAGLLNLEPVPTLLRRMRQELAWTGPLRLSRAPGRLDVMGGIADYTGSLVCEATLDRAAAVALQARDDRQVQVFSFNLLDDGQPFSFQVPLDALAAHSTDELRRDLREPGRTWVGYLVGCLHALHVHGLLNLRDTALRGVNLALYSTVPLGAGVSSSAAIEVAAMMNLADHYGVGREAGGLDPLRLSALCQWVENHVVGAPCGIMDQVTSCAGQQGSLLRLRCQPHTLLPPLQLPAGVRVVGINSRVKHSVGGGMYGLTRCAAFMGHAMILRRMRQSGALAEGAADPMNGYLANLDAELYARDYRDQLPEAIGGQEFLDRFGPTIDTATAVDPAGAYHVRAATDHHVFEARRVRRFVELIEQATGEHRTRRLDAAGELMFESHTSYTENAKLGAQECDVLVNLVRQERPAGLYGAKITGGGSGGTVAVLADASAAADDALERIVRAYEKITGRTPDIFRGDSPGAWQVGTTVI